MPRRSHKKSRAGCHECKKRHIKCDEHKPKCVNCTTAGSSCSFEHSTPASYSTTPVPFAPPAVSRQLSSSAPATPSEGSGSRSVLSFDPNLNLDHLELLYHYTAATCATLAGDEARVRLYQTIVVREALKYPFLMYQLLGMAALHIASESPSKRAMQYYHRATELQSAAMSRIQVQETRTDGEAAFALLIFSSLLGLHVLADHSRTQDLDNEGFLNHVIHTVRLMQGVRVLVVEDWWDGIRARAEIRPFIELEHLEPPYDVPLPLKQLEELITDPISLGQEVADAYGTAIDHLQWMYALTKIPYTTYTTVRMAMAWPVRTSSVYLNLIEQREPEALVILAYFATALHFYRESWVIRDTGARLLQAIVANLDPHWDKWLQWPKGIVASAGSANDAEMTNGIALDPQLEHNTT